MRHLEHFYKSKFIIMKKITTNFLNTALIMLCLFCFGVVQAQNSFGPAPRTSRATVQSNPAVRSLTSDALIALEGTDISHFTLGDPANVTSFGTTAPEFTNSADYINGMYYTASSTSGNFMTIDPGTGGYNLISTGNPYGSIAYNPVDGQTYGLSLGTTPVLYTVDLATGASTQVIALNTTNFILSMTITNDGRFLLIDAEINGISELDPATGNITTLFSAGFTVNYGQDIGMDRETNTPYWAAYNADASQAQLYAIDVANATQTLIGNFSTQVSCFATLTVNNQNIANAPTNFTITPGINFALTADLSWTNPSTTLANAPLTSIDSIVIKRNGTIVHTELNPGVGANMQWTDNTVPAAGIYGYSVHAVTTEGNGIATGGSAEIGELCNIKIVAVDAYGDGWNGASIRILNNGTLVGTASCSALLDTIVVRCPVASLDFEWVAGQYDDECSFTIFDGYDIPIFEGNTAPDAGVFFTYNNTCLAPVPANISGTVTALLDNSPIANATVTISGTPSLILTTDASGSYSGEVYEGFTYDFSVTATGYNNASLLGVVATDNMVQDFQMTAPVMTVTAPASVEVWTNYTIDGHYNPIVITNDGNGTLTWGNQIVYTRSRNSVENIPMNYSIQTMENRINSATSEFSPTSGRIVGEPTRAAWDILSSFRTSASGEQGICTDGNYIYTSFWGTAGQFGVYDLTGNFIETFTIAGVGGIRDLTYDGTYFYGGAGAATLYQMDFNTRTLVSSINTSVPAIRHCSYDSDRDGFWVGNWTDLYFIDHAGSIVITGPTTLSDVYSSAYDPYSAGGPFLWLFSQTAGETGLAVYQQFDINAMTVTNVTHDASDIIGITSGSSAGGSFGSDLLVPGKFVIMANLQDEPNIVAVYDIAETGWLTLSPASGTLQPGESDTVTMNMDGWWAVQGDFNATCTFTSNNPNVGTYDVPVIFHITAPECDAPTNLVVTPTDYDYMHLTWDAPADITDLVEYRIYYNGNQNHFATSNTTSYDDDVNAGNYCYTVRAFYVGDCLSLPTDTVCEDLLPCDPDSACTIRFQLTDSYSDGWNGAKIEMYLDGILINTITSSTTGENISLSVCNGQVTFVWVAGQYDEECSFVIYNAANEVIYTGTTAPSAGQFAAYTQDCGHVGINENTVNNQVNIFPNPVSDVLNVSAPGFQSFEVINFLGQVVYNHNLTSEQTTISVSNLSDGIYFIRFKSDSRVETLKFIKR